jgi:hypothetical protein
MVDRLSALELTFLLLCSEYCKLSGLSYQVNSIENSGIYEGGKLFSGK